MSASRRYRKWFIQPGLNIRIPYYTYYYFRLKSKLSFRFFCLSTRWAISFRFETYWKKKLEITYPFGLFLLFLRREKEFIIKFTLWIDCWKSFWRVIILLSLFFQKRLYSKEAKPNMKYNMGKSSNLLPNVQFIWNCDELRRWKYRKKNIQLNASTNRDSIKKYIEEKKWIKKMFLLKMKGDEAKKNQQSCQ